MDKKASIESKKAELSQDEGGISESGKTPLKPKQSGQGYRRKRTAFSTGQLQTLETAFKWNMYPGVTVRESLATELGISESCVQVWFQNRRSKWRQRENNKRVTHREEQLQKRFDACIFNAYNTAERSWPLPQAQNPCSCQVNGMLTVPPVSTTLMPAISGTSSHLITCASLFPSHAHYDDTGNELNLVGQMPVKLESDQLPLCNDQEESVKEVTNEAFRRERSADELIGANGLLCMGGTFFPFMSSN